MMKSIRSRWHRWTGAKYEWTGASKKLDSGETVYQIQAIRDFGAVKAGELGGWVQGGRNLARRFGAAWVEAGSEVYGNGRVSGNAIVAQNSRIGPGVKISGDVVVANHSSLKGSGGSFRRILVLDHAELNHVTVSTPTSEGRIEIGGHAVVQETTLQSFARQPGQAITLTGATRLEHCTLANGGKNDPKSIHLHNVVLYQQTSQGAPTERIVIKNETAAASDVFPPRFPGRIPSPNCVP